MNSRPEFVRSFLLALDVLRLRLQGQILTKGEGAELLLEIDKLRVDVLTRIDQSDSRK